MEQWRDIPGYEHLYQASTDGRIRTCEGKTTSSARFARRVWKQRVLKQKWRKRKTGSGMDARVTLWKDGKEYTHLVSRLVAFAWCDGYENGMTVNHIDGNPSNNNVSNLEWVTCKENINKAFDMGIVRSAKRCALLDTDGTVTRYRSMASASLAAGKDEKHISYLLSKGKTILEDGRAIII